MNNKRKLKGIVLAGGAGTRLYPASLPISKILLPVYNKPMIYYPLATLMLAGIRDIMIISNPRDIGNFESLLSENNFGLTFSFAVQKEPRGIAESLIIAEDFIGEDNVALILGDNIFHGNNFGSILKNAFLKNDGATVFGYKVKNPSQFGVAEFDKDNKIVSLEEKPKNPKSDYAVTGLYFYDNKCVEYAKQLTPSARGELEITDLNKIYLSKGKLSIEILERGFAWLDTGTHESLFQASNFVQSIETNRKEKIACLEEIALMEGFVSPDEMLKKIEKFKNNEYYDYIRDLITDRRKKIDVIWAAVNEKLKTSCN